MGECAALFGNQQDARSFTIEPVHQLEEFFLGTGHAQLLNHAKTHTRPPVYSNPGRLVYRKKIRVLKKNGPCLVLHRGNDLCRRRLHGLLLFQRPLGLPDRRQSHQVTRLHTGIGTGTPFVDAHFAAANNPVDVGFGNAFELPHQEVVQTLAGEVFLDGDCF